MSGPESNLLASRQSNADFTYFHISDQLELLLF